MYFQKVIISLISYFRKFNFALFYKNSYMCYLFIAVPDLVVTDYDISAQVGDFGFLTCNVSGILPGMTITYQWRRADMSPISTQYSMGKILQLLYVGVSDAGVYICEVNVNVSTNNPYVIPRSGSLSVTLTVTSK